MKCISDSGGVNIIKQVAQSKRVVQILVLILISCTAPPTDSGEFWYNREKDQEKVKSASVFLKEDDLIHLFSEAYVIEETDSLLRQGFTPFYGLEPIRFSDLPGFSLLRRCIPPGGPHRCFTDATGVCICETVGIPDNRPPEPSYVPPACNMSFDDRGKFRCLGECKSGDCTMVFVRGSSTPSFVQIGCACLVQIPNSIQVKNLDLNEIRPPKFKP